MSSYQILAPYYDELMSHVPYDKWVQFTNEQYDKHKISGKRILELGCGTGEIAIRLAAEGYDVTGVDLSEDMLTVGLQKAMEHHVHVQWIKQNIVELTGFEKMDMIVSYLDVMNYITNEMDLEQVFQRVYDSLAPDGIFIFDVHDEQFVKEERIDRTFVEHTDNITYIWECDDNQQPGSMAHYLTFFIKQANGLFEQFTEVHYQQVYSLSFYANLLKSIGFSKIEFYDDMTVEKGILDQKNGRNFILAKK